MELENLQIYKSIGSIEEAVKIAQDLRLTPSQRELVDILLERYKKVILAEFQLQLLKDEIHQMIEVVAGQPEIKKSTITLQGTEEQFKILRKVNVSVDLGPDKDGPHPYRLLAEKYPQLDKMLRVKLEEKGSDIQKLVDSFLTDPSKLDDLDIELAQEILKVRTEKPGKSGISITVIKK